MRNIDVLGWGIPFDSSRTLIYLSAWARIHFVPRTSFTAALHFVKEATLTAAMNVDKPAS